MNSPYFYFCILLAVFLVVTGYYAIKFALLVLKFQDALEESLDVIDEKYKSIAEICERPLFFDSPEVRQVLEDIKRTRDALHGIAFSLSREFEFHNKDIEDNDGTKG